MSENTKNFAAYIVMVGAAVLVMFFTSFVAGKLVPSVDDSTVTTTTTTTTTTTFAPQVQIAPNGPGTGSCLMKLQDGSIIECPPLPEGG